MKEIMKDRKNEGIDVLPRKLTNMTILEQGKWLGISFKI